MKVAYPHSHSFDRLDTLLLSIKIARHSPCSQCHTCSGIHPPPRVDVVLDNHNDSSLGDLGQYGSDDDDDSEDDVETDDNSYDALEDQFHGLEEEVANLVADVHDFALYTKLNITGFMKILKVCFTPSNSPDNADNSLYRNTM